MDESKHYSEIIDNYLLGKLTSEERELIEQQLQTDPQFKEQFSDRKLLHRAFVWRERKKVLDKVRSHTATKNQSTQILFKPNSVWYWAAAAVILLGLSVVLYLTTKSSTSDKLFSAHYEPFNRLDYPKPRSGSYHELALSGAAENYRNEEYAKVLNTVEDLDQDNDVLFLKGLALLGLGQYEDAINAFKNISQDFRNIDAVHWYSALSYLGINDRTNAKTSLLKIKDKAVFKVVTLIDKLE